MEGGHLVQHGVQVIPDGPGDGIVDDSADGLVIRAGTRGQPQSSGGKVVSAVRSLVCEGGTAKRQGELSHVRQVPVGTRPEPPHHRIRHKRRHDGMNDGSFIG